MQNSQRWSNPTFNKTGERLIGEVQRCRTLMIVNTCFQHVFKSRTTRWKPFRGGGARRWLSDVTFNKAQKNRFLNSILHDRSGKFIRPYSHMEMSLQPICILTIFEHFAGHQTARFYIIIQGMQVYS